MKDSQLGIIEQTPFGTITKVEDLVSFDYEPVLTHYILNGNTEMLRYSVDYDNQCRRYLFFAIPKSILKSYLNGEIELYELITVHQTDIMYLMDYTYEDELMRCVAALNIPDKYLPKRGAFFAFHIPEKYKGYFNE